MKIQPYYIAPLLIEQPTWGGQYIANFKHINQAEVNSINIGQSYELAAETLLYDDKSTRSFMLADAASIDKTIQFETIPLISLENLIQQNPEAVLGNAVLKKHGQTMPLLIKFTQAQSNSYQVHFKQGEAFGNWLQKPESWYFFERGKATLGLSQLDRVEAYKQRCIEIYTKAQEISKSILSNQINLEVGKQQLEAFINLDHPSQYVNTIFPEKGSVIDLSQGGTHHSWETDPQLSNGNIVYEVQLDVKDDYCTLRSFDQGKFKDSGEVRNLSIDEYFAALDLTPKANDPDYFLKPTSPIQSGKTKIIKLFDSEHYHLTSIELSNSYSGDETKTTEGFHHLFVQSGEVLVKTEDQDFPLTKGWSLFVPSSTNGYSLHATQATVLKTTC